MSSIIEGYNYDIFISYRQKDNKHDGWVTEFVKNLKGELESTFKEEVGIYFDVNPHEGLLETHNVDESLKDKLKCIIFIPIISQTYCDTKSYAWQHEFLPFLQMIKNDRTGMNVRLRSGNVAGRILPIRIHDLEPEDVKLYENETGSVIRALDFVFKTASGAIRPLLTNEDHPNDNLNKTFYRDQISKAAIAIKEIILGMKAELSRQTIEEDQPEKPHEEVSKDEIEIDPMRKDKKNKIKLLIPIAAVVLLIIAGIIFYPKIFKRNNLERLRASGERISVAVMPFANMTNDTVWNIWQVGIQNELITQLTNSEELRVRQTESINNVIHDKGYANYASLTPSVASRISKNMDANVFVYGSMKQSGKTLRLNTHLIDSRTKEIFKSFQIDGTEEKILQIVDSLSKMIKEFLIISIMEKEVVRDFRPLITTSSSEAYKYYMYGIQAFYKYDNQTATEWLLKAVGIDSTFTEAARMLVSSLGRQGLVEESRIWEQRNYEKRDQMPEMERLWAEIAHAEIPDRVKYFKLLIALDDDMPVPHSNLGYTYLAMHLYDKTITELEKEFEIYQKWGSKPRWSLSYQALGIAYHKLGMYKKEGKLYKKAEMDFPGDPDIICRQAVLALSTGRKKAADNYIEKFKSILKEKTASEANIATGMASIYNEAGLLDKAEDYYREALSLQPDNPYRYNNLAWFLIDKDRNAGEGLELIEKARELNIDEYYYVDCKGYGLLKLGKYKEALEFLERSDSLKPIYDHELFLHLEEARKALATN